jgi:hypothetical protein
MNINSQRPTPDSQRARSRLVVGTWESGVVVLVFLFTLLATACGAPAPDPRAATFVGPAPPAAESLALPNLPGSIKFAVIGDSGRGHPPQYEVSAQMVTFRKEFPFDFVVMLGDNVYDGGTPEDYRQKFELPYKPLLELDVKFYAVIGNHDASNQPWYPPFNMGGRRYYTFRADRSLLARLTDTDAEFFMLDTETLDRTQVAWVDREMARSEARWKIPVFHRPIYTSGRYATPARIFRAALEPVFLSHEVRLALSGHEHFYQRTTAQQGITYFISGGAGSLRAGDIRRSPLVAAGFDIDYHFMLFELTRDELFYQAISRTGHSIDAGEIKR